MNLLFLAIQQHIVQLLIYCKVEDDNVGGQKKKIILLPEMEICPNLIYWLQWNT